MRITNGIMINNSLSNINTNKTLLDTLNTQLASEAKIQRPSDDPIVAIRALRFRSTLSEINHYLDKNIPDASAWLKSTDEAMQNISDVMGDITYYCNQAVNGYYDETNKSSILATLKAFRDQIYSDANADCNGRTIFTGYKTDSTLTFMQDNKKSYEITQKFDNSLVDAATGTKRQSVKDAFDTVTKIKNSVDITNLNVTNIGTFNTNNLKTPVSIEAYRVRLAYDNLDSGATVQIKTTNPDKTITPLTKSSKDLDAYEPGDDSVYFLADTGELIFGKNAYSSAVVAQNMEITYTKTGYKKGELDPTQYFDCIDITDPSNKVTYTSRDQDINYEVNFNQHLTINTQGKNVFTQDMTRDLDEIIYAVNNVVTITNKQEALTKLYNSTTVGSAEREKIQKLIDYSKRELDFANENMKNAFSAGLTNFEKHQDSVNLEKAEVGAKQQRLELNESRLNDQKVTVTGLKTTNEKVNTTAVAIELKEASNVFDASLAAASKVIQTRLLDFL